MSRQAALLATALVGVVLVVILAGGTASGSPTPTGVCVVCGQTFHQNVTATDATLQVEAGGDVRWHVENELADPTATRWRQNSGRARERVLDALDHPYRHPHEATNVTVHVEGTTVVVEFVDRNAARNRFGLLVVPYLHGEGVEARYVINADEFVVEAPDGQRIVNQPAGATVEGDHAVWMGVSTGDHDGRASEAWDAPEPDDTYVVIGSGVTGTVAPPIALTLMPLDPGRYAFYLITLLVVVGIASAGYVHVSGVLERRWLVGGTTLVGAPFGAFVLGYHPIPASGTLPGFGIRVFLLLLAILVGLLGALLYFVAGYIAER